MICFIRYHVTIQNAIFDTLDNICKCDYSNTKIIENNIQ